MLIINSTTANTGLSNEVNERIKLLQNQLNAELLNLASELSPGVGIIIFPTNI